MFFGGPGIDVTANQDDELSDKETFQIEFDVKKEQWRVRTADNVCWKVADASGIQATDDGRSVTNYTCTLCLKNAARTLSQLSQMWTNFYRAKHSTCSAVIAKLFVRGIVVMGLYQNGP